MKSLNLSRARPINFFKTLIRLLSYYKGIKLFLLILVVLLTIFSSIASIVGTFMLKDVISIILKLKSNEATWMDLTKSILLMASLYIGGVISTICYNQIMIRTSQKVIYEIRNDLIKHTLELPVKEFDLHTHGEIMTYFTNDIDTLNTALNDSFANVIFSLSNIVGTLIGLFLLNIYLSLIVVFFLALMVFSFFIILINVKNILKLNNKNYQI